SPSPPKPAVGSALAGAAGAESAGGATPGETSTGTPEKVEQAGPHAEPDFPPGAVLGIAQAPGLWGFRTIKLPNNLEVVLGRRPGMPVLSIGLGLFGGRAAARPLGVADVAKKVAVVRTHTHGLPANYGAREMEKLDADLISYILQAGAGNLGKML